jgi:hypothetical protein
MPNVSAQAVVRDVLAEVDEIQWSKVLRAAAREAGKQLGKAKVQEMARRIASAYLDSASLPFGGAVVKQVALPALDIFVADVLAELETV